uniref:Uncharacterized protein n=1 Tax=Molossus molossus TaxID=27622 RepID=A0A7J8FRU4_MOLMO|nr:hypothetical protein HJG59_008361 [Molossus molossus]
MCASFQHSPQRTAGEDCSAEDPPDDHGPSLAERASKPKAVKLEKEALDLTHPTSVQCSHGLEKKAPIGDKYNPHEHQLICHVPADAGVQPGTVALVRQDGYKSHGHTTGLAQVEVAVESQRGQ